MTAAGTGNTMTLLDGKTLAQTIYSRLAETVGDMAAGGRRAPHLAAILVGNDGASESYVGGKIRACSRSGFTSTLIRLETTVTQDELLERVRAVNDDPAIDGLIVQLPLPRHIAPETVAEAILPSKDVDGFHPVNTGRLVQGRPCFLPATPKGIMLLLEEYGIETEGRRCAVIGRSAIVGTPMGLLLSRNARPGNATVTLCHSRTRDLAAVTREADILVAALGRPAFVTADMVREDAVVIDVGITRVPDPASKRGYRLQGDVDFAAVAPRCSHITPVPGGVGAMTIAGLLMNTLAAARGEIAF